LVGFGFYATDFGLILSIKPTPTFETANCVLNRAFTFKKEKKEATNFTNEHEF
jgi:hypothetical protein